jgi:alkylation response protein AidB-like acyl-CoA dehydrogenase
MVPDADDLEAGASVWRFADDSAVVVWRLLDRASVGVACDSLGMAEAMLNATVISASMAKPYDCAAAAVDVAGKAMQLHGGIGYTWESGIHACLKRAALNRALFGSSEAHRRRLAGRYLSREYQARWCHA